MNALGRRKSLLAATVLASVLIIAAAIVAGGLWTSQSSTSGFSSTGSTNLTTSTESVETTTSYCENGFCVGSARYSMSTPLIRSSVSQGIQLVLNLSTGSWANHTAVLAASAINNTLSTDVMLSSGGFSSGFPCGGQTTSRVDVYAGFYTPANVTSGRPLVLYDPFGFYGCPVPSPPVSRYNYTFHPGRSDVQTYLFGGYWISSGELEYSFQSFPSGWYTVVASDSWGQEAIGYFFASY